ncbi:MAG: GNAT family N-acetyltransferase [Hyphomicrobiaceae bacterium]|nr:GNAT family N-acetyltransferase [Hyphomicrobiaceae bacterium]
MRFAMDVSDSFIENYVSTCFSLDSVIHGYFEDDCLRGVSELRSVGDFSRGDAEAAFSIEPDWRGRSIGTELMRHTLRSARNRRVRRLYMNCLATNKVMQRLARRFKAELEFDAGDVVARVVPDRATPLTLFKEAWADGFGLAAALMQLQRMWLRAA